MLEQTLVIIHDAVLLSALCSSGLICHLIFIYSWNYFSQVFIEEFLETDA